MEIEQRQSELLAAAQFIDKGIARFFQRLLNRVAEVNQVAVVRQDLSGTKAVFFAGGFEFSNCFVAERGSSPLPLVFGKQREGGGVDFGGANGGIGQSAGGADVRSNVFHKKLQLSRWVESNDSGLTAELHQRMRAFTRPGYAIRL